MRRLDLSNLSLKQILMQIRIILTIGFMFSLIAVTGQQVKPLRIGVAGLTHAHVGWLLSRAHDSDIVIVGIAESNREVAEKYLKQYNLPESLLYSSLKEMLDKCKPEAVCAFNSIYEHLEVVKACAREEFM